MENIEANKIENPETEISEIQPKKSKTKAEHISDQPCKYYKADFILNPKILGFDSLIVKTALEQSDMSEFTVEEAKNIVNNFAMKEVKK